MLEMKPTTNVEEVRLAYHRMARKYHPDQFHTQEEQENAHRRMVALNNAYEEALKLATSRASAPYKDLIPCEDAVTLGRRLLSQGNPESALRQLLRASSRDAEWYCTQGDVLMAMEQYESAEQSYREAIRSDPQNNTYRAGALDAVVAARQAKTLGGLIKRLLRKK